MTQQQWILDVFKGADVASLAGSLLWIAVYTYLAKWWDNPVGYTVVRLVIYLAGAFGLVFASLFFHFNRTTSEVAGWIDVGFYSLVAFEMFYRVPLWIRLHTRTDGSPSYQAMKPFLAEVWRRRGRPLWWDGDDITQTPPVNGHAGMNGQDTPPEQDTTA